MNEALRQAEIKKDRISEFISGLFSHKIDVTPFQLRSDVTMRLEEFFSDLEEGVFLRLYIPQERYQAEQLGQLLAVMERYLRQVEGRNFSVDSRKTDQGVLYVFKSIEGITDLNDLNSAIDRFDIFMRLCGDNTIEATNFLNLQGISKEDSELFVAKFSRDFKRILVDTKHEFERKMLGLKQTIENDLIEGNHPLSSLPKKSVFKHIEAEVPSNVTINIGSFSVNNTDILQNNINATTYYNDSDKRLIELFSKYAEKMEALQCRSDLDQLKDKTAPESNRHNSTQRIKGFLRKAASKAGEISEKIAVEALTAYLDRLLKGQI